DPVPRGEDEIVSAPLEVEVAVLVGAHQVTGLPPLALEGLAVEVAAEERGAGGGAELQLAGIVSVARVRDPGLESRQRLAHRARAHRLTGAHSRHLAGLGLAVAVVDLEPDRFSEDADDLRVERLAGRDQVA